VSATPFRYIHHLVTVPVVVGGTIDGRFVLDSGIGLTLFTESFCDAVGCEPDGSTFTGKRMSGQDVDVPLTSASSLSMGSATQQDVVVGVLDMSGFPEDLDGIDGFLSLAFFESTPFTVDYFRRVVVVESETSLAARVAAGHWVDVRVDHLDQAVVAFLPLTLPGGGPIVVEVDMGSDALILNQSLAPDVGVALDDPAVRRVEGRDETGQVYTRFFDRIQGTIHATDAPEIRQEGPEVMFQEIIYDGLVGDAFLRNFVVTFDVSNERMIFGLPP
jgi:hypothetical protein